MKRIVFIIGSAVVALSGSTLAFSAVQKNATPPFVCEIANCTQTAEHQHMLCNIADCEITTKHNHEGNIFFGHYENDGHDHQQYREVQDAGIQIVVDTPVQSPVQVTCDVSGCTLTHEHTHSICDVSGCTLTHEHTHSICNISGCSIGANHEHDGLIHYGHSSDDGHAYHNESSHSRSGHGGKHH